MWTAIIAGIFALLGGFVGAFMHRKTQHQNWILQKRAEIFADFLQTLEKCRDETSKFFREGMPEGVEKTQKILDLYQPVLANVKITRLFLKDESKKEIAKLVDSLYSLHNSEGFGDQRFSWMDVRLKRIQNILEENLKDPKW